MAPRKKVPPTKAESKQPTDVSPGTVDTWFAAAGSTDVSTRFSAYTGDTPFGGFFDGNHVGAQGRVRGSDAGNFGVVGSVGFGFDTPPFSAGAGPVGVWGTCTTGPGVVGTSSNEAGVYGLSSANVGVVGVSNTSNGIEGTSIAGIGVAGGSTSSSGVVGQSGDGYVSAGTAGVVGTSQALAGVYGASSSSVGVVGVSDTGVGINGTSKASWGVGGGSTNSSGVVGMSGAPPTANWGGAIAGVIGASRDHAGVYGVSDNYAGVYGTSNNFVAVAAITSGGVGVYTTSDSSWAVQAESNSSIGVYAASKSSFGLFGASGDWGTGVPNTIDPVAGILGTSSKHIGVLGTSNTEAGVAGYSRDSYGVYGEGGTGAAYFRGNVTVEGDFTVVAPHVKNVAMQFPDGSHRLMHCMESPEHWFEDFGAARLKRGRAVVKLDADFAKTISTGDYRVFLTPEGDCGGLYIKSKRGDGFEVRELQGGTSSVAFCYRIVGRRRDIKRHKRFARIDITPPMQVTKPRASVGRTAARVQAFTRKLRAAMEKHAALAAKSARGRKVRSRRRGKARA